MRISNVLHSFNEFPVSKEKKGKPNHLELGHYRILSLGKDFLFFFFSIMRWDFWGGRVFVCKFSFS